MTALGKFSATSCVLVAVTSMSIAEDAGVWIGNVPREGRLFPDIPLPLLEGGEGTSIRSFRGKKVLLLAFASW